MRAVTSLSSLSIKAVGRNLEKQCGKISIPGIVAGQVARGPDQTVLMEDGSAHGQRLETR